MNYDSEYENIYDADSNDVDANDEGGISLSHYALDDIQEHGNQDDPHDHSLETTSVSSMMDKLHQKLHHTDSSDISFGSVKYTDAEIDKMEHDVDMAEYEVSCRKSDVSLWESKVSLNNTEEHRANGDYANAISRLNEAKSRYNNAVDRLNSAKSKLNNAL